MIRISFAIPGTPITKKNSSKILRDRRTGRPFIVPSDQYKKYEQAAATYCPKLNISSPVNCKYVYYMPTHRRVDLSNLVSATDDILVAHGTLADDNRDIVAGHDGSAVFYDKQNPRVEIQISTVNGYEQWKMEEK